VIVPPPHPSRYARVTPRRPRRRGRQWRVLWLGQRHARAREQGQATGIALRRLPRCGARPAAL